MNIPLRVNIHALLHVRHKSAEDPFAFFDGQQAPAMQHHHLQIIGEHHFGGEEIKLRVVLQSFEADGIHRFLARHEVLYLR